MLDIEQTEYYERWFGTLRDKHGRLAISRQISRIAIAERLVGDWKPVGKGVYEIRIQGKGPGYRIYLSIEGRRLLILLLGGDKRSQSSDIALAQRLHDEIREQVTGDGD